MLPNNETKKQTILGKNTYFLNMVDFNDNFEIYIQDISKLLIDIYNTSQESISIAQRNVFVKYIQKEYGLLCILALTGLSKETFERILKFAVDVDDEQLNQTLMINEWQTKTHKYDKIEKLVKTDDQMAIGITNLLFGGGGFANFTASHSII